MPTEVRKVASDDKDIDFECYDRFEGKPVPFNVDKEMTESNKPTLALLPNRLEKDGIKNNVETRDRDDNNILHRSNRILTPPEWLVSVPKF